MDTTHDNLVGEMIRHARDAKELSRYKAADLAGVSEATIRQLENGVRIKRGEVQPATTTAETLTKIAEALDINHEELLKAAGFPPEAAEVVTHAPPQAKSTVIDLEDFPEREAELIRTFADGLRMGIKGRGTRRKRR